MKYSYKDIKLPKWLSYKTYFPLEDKSRTYIFNEKKHTYIQLDEISSDFWHCLVCGEDEFLQFVADNNLNESTDSFLEDLAEQGLILLKDYKSVSNVASERFERQKVEEYVNFVEDMNRWLYDNGFMSSIFFELTYRCNLECIHCYNPKNTFDEEIPFDEIKKIINDAYNLGCFSVIVSGGESTTYTHFAELISYIREKHMALEVFTNGQLLADNESLYKTLLNNYPHRVGISLYSNNKEKHDKVTNKNNSYEKTIKVINKLRSDGIYVQIKNFLLNFTCDDCIEIAKLGEEIDVNVTSDISLIPTIDGDKKTFKYALSNENLFKLFINPKSPLYIGEKPYLFNLNEHKDESLCFGGFSGVCISPSLDVHVCSSLPLNLGNLYDENLKDIWKDANSKKENSKLYDWRKKTYKDLKECYKESYCKFCNYCAGMAYLENGYLKKSDILCQQARAKEKAYKYLCENGKFKKNQR